MVDFHSHILPGMDDGAKDTEESLALLRDSVRQGVTAICATPHFIPDEEEPASFLRRRTASGKALREAMQRSPGKYPRILLGAEIRYFPGIGASEDIGRLRIGKSACLLIEPPMARWTDFMLDEIEALGKNLRCYPVIAHVDRYMRFLEDSTLLERLQGRRIFAQVNGSYFLHEDTAEDAVEQLRSGKIHFLGSDCHNMDRRAPNLGAALEQIRALGGEEAFGEMEKKADILLKTLANP